MSAMLPEQRRTVWITLPDGSRVRWNDNAEKYRAVRVRIRARVQPVNNTVH